MLLKSLKIAREIKRNEKIFYSDKYYKDINEIPLYNYWKCLYGDLTFLWKKRTTDIPFFFQRIFNDMEFQKDYIDLSSFRRKVESNYYESKYLVTGDIKYKRKAGEKLLQAKSLEPKGDTEAKLNDVIKFVQIALNLPFQINPHEISAGYFFSLYRDAEKLAQKNSYGYN